MCMRHPVLQLSRRVMKAKQQWIALAGLLLVLLTPCHGQDEDPCSDTVYTLMDMHHGRRESTYTAQDREPLICDDNIESDSWVRFVRDGTSYQLTNQECVVSDNCGTQSPLWMSKWSSHPTTINTEVTATACVNYGFSSCCSAFSTMRVRMCEEGGQIFYVYRLAAPPGCFGAYCVDPVEGACPPKLRRDISTGECIAAYPAQDPPTLLGPTDEGTFSCQLSYTGDENMADQARFEVRFLFNGMAVHKPVSVGIGESATLEEEYLQMGSRVSCSSTAYWSELPDEPTGPEVMSANEYNIGVQFLTNRIVIDEADDEAKEVKLWATLPVVCGDEPCSVCTNLTADGILLAECEYCFPSTGWNPSEKRTYGDPLKVRAVKNIRLDETTVHVLKFGPFWYKYNNPDAINRRTTWDRYEIDDIAVVASDTEHGLCTATGDPHVVSFDGKYFSVHDKGQFLMFKSTAARVFEVHARFWSCGDATCICAVAVREGNAVLGVDMCGSQLKIKKYSSDSLPPGAYYTEDEYNTTYIKMPSGAFVKVDTFTGGLNVFIHALPEDREVSSGLCGNFDGDPENDLTLKDSNIVDPTNGEQGSIPRDFSNSYRIPRFQSFFDSMPPWSPVDVPDQDLARCRCGADTTDCSQGGQTVEPPSDDEEQPEFDYGLDFIPETDFTWPTQSGISRSRARTICRETLQALSYHDDCLRLTGIDDQPSILQCMQDIKMKDDTTWGSASIASFRERCRFLILQDRTLYTVGDDGELKPPVQIIGKMCPSQCSGRGSCVEGICKCDADCLQSTSPTQTTTVSTGTLSMTTESTLSTTGTGHDEVDDNVLLSLLAGLAGVFFLIIVVISVVFCYNIRHQKAESKLKTSLYEVPADEKGEHLYSDVASPSDIVTTAWM